MAFKHINANEQIVDGSIGTSLLADESVTSAKLAFDAITSSNFLVNSNIDFHNFQALEFRIENLNFFPVAGNPGRLIWRTDLQDMFVDSDFTLNIISITDLPLQIGIIADATHMSVSTTTGLSVGDAIIQGGFPFTQVDILSTIDTTHLVVASTAGVVVNNVLVQAGATSIVTSVIDATHMTVANTNGFQPGSATVSTPFVVAVIQSITDGTHLVVDSTAGFVGQAIVSVAFGIVTVTDGTHLVIDDSTAMVAGDTITQGLTSTIITAVTDLTHITVASTAGLTTGIATVFAPVNVLAIPDSTHLVVTSTAGFGPGDPINQGAASTTITSVVDATHLVVGNTNGFALNAAKDSTITVDSTGNTSIGAYLNQTPNSTVIIAVPDATHLAVADSTGFIPGPAFTGSWVSINEGASVTSIRADNNPQLHGNIQFLSGTNTHLPQLGQTITVNVPAAGATGYLQFNNDAQNDFGADANLFWNNVSKRLGIGNSAPIATLDVTGNAHTSADLTVDTKVNVDEVISRTANLSLQSLTSGQAVVDLINSGVGGRGETHVTIDGVKLASFTRDGGGLGNLEVANFTGFPSEPSGVQLFDVGQVIAFGDAENNAIELDASVGGQVQIDMSTATKAWFMNVSESTGAFELIGSTAGKTWTFDAAGTLTTPGNAVINGTEHVTGNVTFDALLNFTDATDALITFPTGSSSQIVFVDANHSNIGTSDTAGNQLSLNGVTQINFSTANSSGEMIVVDNGTDTQVAIGHFPAAPAASAVLDLSSSGNNLGFLPPRLTTVQRDAIVSPATGLMIYNTTSSLFNFYTGTSWLPVGSPVGNVGDVQFNAGGGLFGANPNFFWDDTNVRLGIGNAAPALTLDVSGPVAIRNVSNVAGHGDLTFYNDAPAETTIESRSSDGSTVFGNILIASGGMEIQENGAVPIQISTNTSGTIQTWSFNADGSMAFPALGNGTNLTVTGSDGLNYRNPGTSAYFQLFSDHSEIIYFYNEAASVENFHIGYNHNFTNQSEIVSDTTSLNVSVNGNTWLFDTTGNTTVPASSHINPASGHLFITTDQLCLDETDGSLVFLNDGHAQVIFNNAANSVVLAGLYSTTAGPLRLAEAQVGQPVEIQTSTSTWTFDDTGLLTTPGNISLPNNQEVIFGDANGYNVSYNTNRGELSIAPNNPSNTQTFVGAPGLIEIDANSGLDGTGPYLPNIVMGTGVSLALNVTQSFNIGTTTAPSPIASAIVQIASTTQGFLPPVMTTTQKNAISSPATGLMVYDTTLNNLQEYNGTMWRNVAPLYQQDIFHPTGPGNVFTLTFTPLMNSQAVFYNGLALAPGATEDYTISGNVVTLNAGIVLANGDKILVTYSY